MGGWTCKENGGKILNIVINIKLKKILFSKSDTTKGARWLTLEYVDVFSCILEYLHFHNKEHSMNTMQ